MAATGSNHKERHLAQPPRSVRAAVTRRHGLQYSLRVTAVLLAVVLCLVVSVLSSSPADATTLLPAADMSGTVVPIIFPMENREDVTYWVDTFGAARSGGRTHAGNDLMAPKMSRIVAVVDGKVEWMNTDGKKLSSYNGLPYYNILLRGDDGNDYFYVHLNNDTPGTDDAQGGPQYAYAPGLTNGSRVKAGDFIGYVGDSGNAEDTGAHLHFEIHLGRYKSAASGQTRSPSAINPYASLKAAPTFAEFQAGISPPTTVLKPTTTTTAPRPTTTTTTTAKPTTTTTTTNTGVTEYRSTTTTVPKTTTTLAGSAVAGYDDVRTTDWFYRDFAQALAAGIVSDETDDRFRPYSQVSRALFTVYLVRTMAPGEIASLGAADVGNGRATAALNAIGEEWGSTGLSAAGGEWAPGDEWSPVGGAGSGSDVALQNQIFADVPVAYWAFNEIEAAARLGLVRGTGDGTSFSPDAMVTRAQMATMICRALGADFVQGSTAAAYALFKDIPKGYWAQGSIVLVHTYGLMCGDTQKCFRPEENTNRAQAITVMARLLRLLQGEAGS